MEETNDQVQEDSQESTGPVTIKRDEPDQAPEEQSETTEDVEEAKDELFEDRFGNKLTAQQLHEKYMETAGYITRLEQERKEWEESAQKEAAKAVSENELLANVDPNVRGAIIEIVTPVIQDALRQKDAESEKRAQQEAFDNRISELRGKYPGGDGRPKFDEIKVLAAMQDPSNRGIYDPEAMYWELNRKALIDYEVKQALKGKSSDVKTEDTGSSQPRKPDKSPPKTWDQATKSAISRG